MLTKDEMKEQKNYKSLRVTAASVTTITITRQKLL